MFTSQYEEDSFDLYDEPRLHLERLLKARLVEFDLPLRVLIPLENAGIKTLGDLSGQTRETLLAIPNIGVTSVENLVNLMHGLDLKLADD